MNRQEHLLTIVGEECAEVHQRCSKALRFGMDEIQPEQDKSNAARILEEFDDLCASLEMLFDCPIENMVSRSAIMAKKSKVERFLKYSAEQKTLQQ